MPQSKGQTEWNATPPECSSCDECQPPKTLKKDFPYLQTEKASALSPSCGPSIGGGKVEGSEGAHHLLKKCMVLAYPSSLSAEVEPSVQEGMLIFPKFGSGIIPIMDLI